MDSIFPSKVEYKQIDTFIALCDGLIYDTTVDEIKDVIAPDFPQEKLQEYVKTFTRPSQTPGFREAIYDTINSNTTNASRSFGILCNILGSRILAPTLTNSLTPIKDMTLKERETLLASWRDSPWQPREDYLEQYVPFLVQQLLDWPVNYILKQFISHKEICVKLLTKVKS